MEPWHQSKGITHSEVRRIIEHSFPHRSLYDTITNERWMYEYSNRYLQDLLYEDFKYKLKPLYKHITFGKIREKKNWNTICKNILSEEIAKEKSFGSYRGFIFGYRKVLLRAYIKKVVQECWAKPVLCKFVNIWLKNHYQYGGNGFLKAKEHFNNITL